MPVKRGDLLKSPRQRVFPQVIPDDILFYSDECRTPRQFSNLMRKLQSCIPFQYMLCCSKNANAGSYTVAHAADLDFPEKFQQWCLKSDKINKDPLFHECLRTQQCQIWTDIFRRRPHLFDREYVKKVKEFHLEHTMAGTVTDVPNELAGYFCLTMGSEKACRDYIKVFADLLPSLWKALKNAYWRRPSFRPPLLTEKQKHILQLAAEGCSHRNIARPMGITGRTVRQHLAIIRKKLHAKNQVHAVALAMRYKLIA